MSLLDDIQEEVWTPTTLLRLVPFVGWPALFFDMFQAWGALGKGAEFMTHLAPGLVAGDSFYDAFMADYGLRLKIAAGAMLGPALAAASPAASAALGTGGGAAVDAAEKKAREEIGDVLVDRLKREVGDRADREMNQAFGRVVSDAPLAAELKALPSNASAADLAARGLDVDTVSRRMSVRPDVAALAINAILHRRVYGVTEQTFDPASGAAILPPQEVGRADGTNSTWALIDLLEGQNAGLSPAQLRNLEEDLDRAKRVEEGQPATDTEIAIELLQAEKRGADPAYVRTLEDRLDTAMRKPPRRIRIAAALQKRGARLGHLRFAGVPGIAFVSSRPVKKPPVTGLDLGIQEAATRGILKKGGELLLVTSPLWFALLFAPRSP